MSLWRKNPRRDAIEPEIISALKAVGAERVTQVSGKGAPDLIWTFRGQLFAAEVKSEGGKRTEAQKKTLWPIVRSVDEALRYIGALR